MERIRLRDVEWGRSFKLDGLVGYFESCEWLASLEHSRSTKGGRREIKIHCTRGPLSIVSIWLDWETIVTVLPTSQELCLTPLGSGRRE